MQTYSYISNNNIYLIVALMIVLVVFSNHDDNNCCSKFFVNAARNNNNNNNKPVKNIRVILPGISGETLHIKNPISNIGELQLQIQLKCGLTPHEQNKYLNLLEDKNKDKRRRRRPSPSDNLRKFGIVDGSTITFVQNKAAIANKQRRQQQQQQQQQQNNEKVSSVSSSEELWDNLVKLFFHKISQLDGFDNSYNMIFGAPDVADDENSNNNKDKKYPPKILDVLKCIQNIINSPEFHRYMTLTNKSELYGIVEDLRQFLLSEDDFMSSLDDGIKNEKEVASLMESEMESENNIDKAKETIRNLQNKLNNTKEQLNNLYQYKQMKSKRKQQRKEQQKQQEKEEKSPTTTEEKEEDNLIKEQEYLQSKINELNILNEKINKRWEKFQHDIKETNDKYTTTAAAAQSSSSGSSSSNNNSMPNMPMQFPFFLNNMIKTSLYDKLKFQNLLCISFVNFMKRMDFNGPFVKYMKSFLREMLLDYNNNEKSGKNNKNNNNKNSFFMNMHGYHDDDEEGFYDFLKYNLEDDDENDDEDNEHDK